MPIEERIARQVPYGARSIVAATPDLGASPPGLATLIPATGIGVSILDSVVTGWMEPTHTLESNIGTEKLEDGSPVTDHVVAMPAKLRLTGVVSDVTMGSEAASTAWEAISRLHAEEAILIVVTEYAVYEEMVIKSVRTTKENRGMEFTLELQQIVRVGVGSSSQVPASVPADSPIAGKGAEIDAGDKDLIDAPVTPLGNRRFRLGTAQDPDAQIIEYRLDADGNPITDDAGNIRYFTVDPAE